MGNPKRTPDDLQAADELDNPQFVTALARGMSILGCFDSGSAHLGNQDIAARTRLPKATVSRLTFTLASLGFLGYSRALEKYSLGPGIAALARSSTRAHNFAVAHPLMQKLADHCRSAVMLGTLVGSHMVLLEICEGDSRHRVELEAGARVPHSSTALGRAFVAALPQLHFERFLARLSDQCPTAEWAKVKAGIVRARKDFERYGFCFSLGHWNPELYAVGVPLTTAEGAPVFSLSVSGRASAISREQLVEDFGPRLQVLGQQIRELVPGWF
jgi:DNA-binding IclR family transcriptional regulator